MGVPKYHQAFSANQVCLDTGMIRRSEESEGGVFVTQETNDLPAGLDSSQKPCSFQEERKIRLLFFNKIQEAMRQVPNFFEVCKASLDTVTEGLDAENCSLMFKNATSGELSIRVARGKKDAASVYYPDHYNAGRRFGEGEGIAGFVMKEGRALMINNVKEEPRFINGNGSEKRILSLACCPIRERDEVVGVLNVSHPKRDAFRDEEYLAMIFVASQIGAALAASRFCHGMGNLLGGDALPAIAPSSYLNLIKSKGVVLGKSVFLYTSEKMRQIKEVVDKVANTDVTVLFQGESGVGKEVLARLLYLSSSRRDKPFVRVNCAAIPQELVESELFGYEKGAFTGAYRQKPGKFEMAHEGTIFLDEISEIDLSLQAKLLHVLQDKEFSRLGSNKEINVDVRIIAATNKNLEDAVRKGKFREDLYYRLNVVNIKIPPLRERREELQVFVEYFLNRFSKKYGKKVAPFSPQLAGAFMQYPWFGNVRELENVIQRYVVLGDEREIFRELEKEPLQERKEESPKEEPRKGAIRTEENPKGWPSLREIQRKALTKAESEIIPRVLESSGWDRKKAARALGISYKALLYKMKACNISKPETPFYSHPMALI